MHLSVEPLLFYLERCWAVAGAASAVGAAGSAPAGPPSRPQPLGAEESCWLLELLCALCCAACLHPQQGPLGAAFLSRAATGMLTELPLLGGRSVAEHAQQLSRADKADPARQRALWSRLAALLAATAAQLAAAARGGSCCWADLQASQAKALLVRLSLAAGSTLASLAVRYRDHADLPADLPGALYAALQAARPALPALPLGQLEAARHVGQLANALHEAAAAVGTALFTVGWGPRLRRPCS